MIKYTFKVVFIDVNTNLICRSETFEIEAACEYDAFHVIIDTALAESGDNEELYKIELDKYEVI